MQHMDNHSQPNGAAVSQNADGVWRNLKPAPGLWAADVAVPEGQSACVVVQQGQMAWVGPEAQLSGAYQALPRHDARGALATPGLVDCHTHLVYGGQRANEFAMRLAGATYEEVAQAGGGIVSSVKATRAASEEELFALAAPRLQALLDEGVCAIEIKSGYGLALEHERKCLGVARALADLGVDPGPELATTTYAPPAKRSKGVMVKDPAELVAALKSKGLL